MKNFLEKQCKIEFGSSPFNLAKKEKLTLSLNIFRIVLKTNISLSRFSKIYLLIKIATQNMNSFKLFNFFFDFLLADNVKRE